MQASWQRKQHLTDLGIANWGISMKRIKKYGLIGWVDYRGGPRYRNNRRHPWLCLLSSMLEQSNRSKNLSGSWSLFWTGTVESGSNSIKLNKEKCQRRSTGKLAWGSSLLISFLNLKSNQLILIEFLLCTKRCAQTHTYLGQFLSLKQGFLKQPWYSRTIDTVFYTCFKILG